MSAQCPDNCPCFAAEQQVIAKVFAEMLEAATTDGAAKRQRAEKPSWWRDEGHEAAIFSHLNRWKHGELVDPTSKAHPLVHLAWRALALAYQETQGKVNPMSVAETYVPLVEGRCSALMRGEDGWKRGCTRARMEGSLLCAECYRRTSGRMSG